MSAAEFLRAVVIRSAEATPGPWTWDCDSWLVGEGNKNVLTAAEPGIADDIRPVIIEHAPDGDLIAHARTDLPRMAAALRAVLGLLDELRDDATYHESRESDPAGIRTQAGWKNVDDYRQDIEAAITAILCREATS